MLGMLILGRGRRVSLRQLVRSRSSAPSSAAPELMRNARRHPTSTFRPTWLRSSGNSRRRPRRSRTPAAASPRWRRSSGSLPSCGRRRNPGFRTPNGSGWRPNRRRSRQNGYSSESELKLEDVKRWLAEIESAPAQPAEAELVAERGRAAAAERRVAEAEVRAAATEVRPPRPSPGLRRWKRGRPM